MQWEILVAVVLAIGICTAVIETRAKRMARKKAGKNAGIEQYPVKEASEKQNK